MKYKLFGQVEEITDNWLYFLCNDIVYEIEVFESIQIDKFVYVYEIITETSHTMYGFENKEQQSLFRKLIQISGIGPKSALKIIGSDKVEKIIRSINNADYAYLSKIKGLNDKKINDILIKFRNKLLSSDEIRFQKALKGLGYKTTEISKIDFNGLSGECFDQKLIEAIALIGAQN